MPSLEEELQEIECLTNLELIKKKKTARKSQLTKLTTSIHELEHTAVQRLKPKELERKIKEAHRSSALFAALQTRHEAILEDKEPAALGDEESLGMSIVEDNNKLIDKAEALLERVLLHCEASVILEDFQSLLAAEDPSKPVYQKTFADLKSQITNIKRKARFQEDSDLSDLISELTLSVTKFQQLVARSQPSAADAAAEPTATPSDSSEPRKTSYHSNITLELPKFSGKAVDWAAFKKLFTAVIDTACKGLPDQELHCHLLKAMQTDVARRVVTNAGNAEDCYQQALSDLEEVFGRPSVVYPHYVVSLIKPGRCTYDAASMGRLRELGEAGVRGLKSCDGYTIENFLACIFLETFDERMEDEWSHHYTSTKSLPKIDQVMEFLKARQLAMKPKEPTTRTTSAAKTVSRPETNRKTSQGATYSINRVESASFKCFACGSPGHPVLRCEEFRAWTPEKRMRATRAARHCFNCLSHCHSVRQCDSVHTCRICRERHHTLLHRNTASTNQPATAASNTASTNLPAPAANSTDTISTPPAGDGSIMFAYTSQSAPAILLTAMFSTTVKGLTQVARLLMDPGSTSSLITETLTKRLKLKKQPHAETFNCASGPVHSKHIVNLNLGSVHGKDDVVNVWCHVVPTIPSSKPPYDVRTLLNHPLLQGKSPLADPELGGHIDLLLSITDSSRCARGNSVSTSDRAAIVTPTVFGWAVGGSLPGAASDNVVMNVSHADDQLDQVLERLWQLDKTPEHLGEMSRANQAVVAHFKDTHQVLPDGRFAVQLKRKDHPPTLGASRPAAYRRLIRNEKQLGSEAAKKQFQEAVLDYVQLEHAEPVPPDEINIDPSKTFYLPNRGVVKESSTTTKLRVVFDGSAKSTSGASFNDQLESGPNLYPLLPSVINHFRLYSVAMTADISRMFREIVLQECERDYHRFLARDTDGKVKDFRMRRLTFGIKASPFLATQVLLQLAENYEDTYPLASQVIRTQFYVDDCLTGADSVEKATDLFQELCNQMSRAGMKLRKWRSNSPEFLATVPEELRESADLHLTDPLEACNTLGLHWHVNTDDFHVAVPEVLASEPVTKRTIASAAAQVFDILGIYAPITIVSRVLLQELWKVKIGWDQPIPAELETQWQCWTKDLHCIARNPIRRRLVPKNTPVAFHQVHGFSDASSKAYGVVIYLRTVYQDTATSVSLVMGKARVAPLKQHSIPKLELTAAHLLAKMLDMVSRDLGIPKHQVFAWTDSSIVLAWLKRSSDDLRTFEGNRVGAIQELVPEPQWRHVRTDQNPADLASRGCTAPELLSSCLWWQGPSWLCKSPAVWPQLPSQQPLPPNCHTGLKSKICMATVTREPINLWTRWSCFHKLVRAVAWMRRFYTNARIKDEHQRQLTHQLTLLEIEEAERVVFRSSQQESYSSVFEMLQNHQPLPKGHHLAKYDLVVDNHGLLRVSGRARSSNNHLQPKTYLPLNLSSNLTKLYVTTLHRNLKHAGTSVMLGLLAESFHIPGIRNFLKQLVRTCVICQKVFANPTSQLMGMLPTVRTEPELPFLNVGIDYAGPFPVRIGKPRSWSRQKAYAVLFVCMYTKAIHIEVCEKLSTEEFLAVLRRFCARRGSPANIYSDNGSNFLGAKKEFEDVKAMLESDHTQQQISHLSTIKKFKWHLIPPRAPHIGGLWEAGVKT